LYGIEIKKDEKTNEEIKKIKPSGIPESEINFWNVFSFSSEMGSYSPK
jgi:hypothetical protein